MGLRRPALLVFVCAATVVPGYAQDCVPVMPARIDQEWAHYKALPGAEPNSGSDQYECISIKKSFQLVCRTTKANPAHPSIIIRTMKQDGKAISVQTVGDTAADCKSFLAMLGEYKRLDAQMSDRMHQEMGH